MKKFFSKFLIVILILGFFLAPTTPKIDTQNHFSLVKNEARAEIKYYYEQNETITTGLNSTITSPKIRGPFDNLTECQNSENKQIKSTIVRSCFPSDGTPKTTGSTQNSAPLTPNIDPNSTNNTTDFFKCNLLLNPISCILATIYYIIWTPISWITMLAARILDFFLWYSLESNSYNVEFVTSGWALVRDIANLFFIVALLYIAGKTVLGLNSSNNKKVITMVVMMALLINFSLFISKVVIDASNILARVFYASIENKGPNGQQNIAGDGKEKAISVGLVETFDPQSLFIKSGKNSLDDDWTLISTFAVLMIVTGALMVYMIIAFLSIAFLFVGRVVGLWILMIFAPLAFASYTMPDFKIPKFGHGEWWNDLIKLSFMAPIFIFFLYLIVSFGDIFKLVVYGENGDVFDTGAQGNVDNIKTYLSVIIPFALVYVLLKQAKETTTKMAGEIAQAVNQAGKGLTTLALGGAALGTAALGRATLGRFAKGASTGDTAASRLAAGTSTSAFDRLNGQFQTNTIVGRWINQQRTAYGERLNRQGHEISHASHARHDLDQMASTATHGAKKKWDELTGDERLAARVTMERTNWMRQNGFGNRTWAQLTDIERNAANTAIGVDNHGQIINTTSNLYNNRGVADALIRDARRKVGTLENIEQSAIGGSFDIRNLAKMVSLENDTTANKILTGTTSLLAQNMRLGLRKSFDGTTGESQKNFLKDLSKTLTEAFKSVKLEVDLSNVGHEAKEDHGGGHGGGHH